MHIYVLNLSITNSFAIYITTPLIGLFATKVLLVSQLKFNHFMFIFHFFVKTLYSNCIVFLDHS